MGNSFLLEVMGEEGLKALNGAVDRLPLLKSVLLPRAVVSWVSTVGKLGWEGGIPGLDNSYLSLFKNEDDTYTGALTIKDELYTFDKADLLHVSASVGVALDLEAEPIDEKLKKKDLTQLGNGIDLLVKSNIIKKAKKKEQEEESKEGPPGPALQPLAAEKPVKPSVGQEPPKPNMALSKPKLKVTKSESEKVCSLCNSKFFNDVTFVGCKCLSDLAPLVKTEPIRTPNGVAILMKFDKRLDEESVKAIIIALKT